VRASHKDFNVRYIQLGGGVSQSAYGRQIWVWQWSDGSTRNNLGTLELRDASHTDRTFGIRSLTPSLFSHHM
jgi:hypothetical protein